MSRYRWAVLGAGTFAQTSYSAIWYGIAVLAPALRREYGLSLAQTGALISMSLLGSIATLLLWGLATDRVGERLVLFAGLAVCGAALIGAGFAHGFEELAALLFVAGGMGASVQSASGRAVMHWFPAAERGLALAVRQTAIPISGFVVAIVLPLIERGAGVPWSFAAMGLACLAGAVVGAAVLREGPRHDAPAGGGPSTPLRDRRLWRLSIGGALVIAAQLCVVGFTVVFLHDHRGLSTRASAAVLAVMQLLAIGGRLAAGRWSDIAGSRLRPFRLIVAVTAVLVALIGLLAGAPLGLLLPVLVAGGVLAMSWNSLAFAAAVELAGHQRSGVAIGFQQTVLNGAGAVYPALFGLLVSATSWSVAFLVLALFPLVAWRVLRPLPG